MKNKAYIVLGYALLLFIGGLIGYFKAGSVVSIITSSFFALLAAISGVAMLNNSVLGRFVATGISVALAAFFIYRFMLTYTFMPAGLMAIVSLLVLAALVVPKSTSSLDIKR
jgi:uncharacterized membrane protein (UPF0136 family)